MILVFLIKKAKSIKQRKSRNKFNIIYIYYNYNYNTFTSDASGRNIPKNKRIIKKGTIQVGLSAVILECNYISLLLWRCRFL